MTEPGRLDFAQFNLRSQNTFHLKDIGVLKPVWSQRLAAYFFTARARLRVSRIAQRM